jgi:hypothetical protein
MSTFWSIASRMRSVSSALGLLWYGRPSSSTTSFHSGQ